MNTCVTYAAGLACPREHFPRLLYIMHTHIIDTPRARNEFYSAYSDQVKFIQIWDLGDRGLNRLLHYLNAKKYILDLRSCVIYVEFFFIFFCTADDLRLIICSIRLVEHSFSTFLCSFDFTHLKPSIECESS